MNIVDRINKISGVEETHWDSAQNRLVVYYSDSIPVDTMKIRIAGALHDAELQDSIDTTTLISVH